MSLIPQALSGRLPEAHLSRRRRRQLERGGPPTLANGITTLFFGMGFLLVSLALGFSDSGRGWWYWMLIPAFLFIGKGIAQIVGAKYGPDLTPGVRHTAMPQVPQTGQIPPREVVIFPPPSVTEQTTRQLDPKTDPYRYRDRDAE
ncbi:MAG: phage holin family protein [Blastocatellia bacterium]